MADPLIDAVNIRPEISMLSVLPHLNYRAWYALAEFVDNALQSFLDHQEGLAAIGGTRKLRIEIEIEPGDTGSITIRDNAAGIHASDFPRAFRPASVPTSRSGLSEFGMGMKSAACWFASYWQVRTKALGESVERTVTFDLDEILLNGRETLKVATINAPLNSHYTEVSLKRLRNRLMGRTLGKVREHLASIYREFFREGLLDLGLRRDGVIELLSYTTPPVLVAPPFRAPLEAAVRWEKEINFDFGNGLKARGFAALRDEASTSHAGFALFRRKRLIQGSADESYRPTEIFKLPNSYTYQRLFGELHLEGFEVSHTKDGFKWDENEETFLEILKEQLNDAPLPLLDQAEGYRAKTRNREDKTAAQAAVDRTAELLEKTVPAVVERQSQTPPDVAPPPIDLPSAEMAGERVIDIDFRGQLWRVHLELSEDPAIGEWLSVSDTGPTDQVGSGKREVRMRLSLAHPFMVQFTTGPASMATEPLLRVATAIGLAEVAARLSGVRQAGTIRRNVNQLLRDALSRLE